LRVQSTPGLDENLRLQDRVAQRLVELRRRQGALSLETIETKAVFDGDTLSDLDPDRKNRARQLIEDFMIAANGVTATYLESKGFPSLRRVLRSPERWDRIAQLASSDGDRLPNEPDAPALEAFLARRRKADPDGFPDLSLAVVKLIGRGEYALDLPGSEPPGHFGLAVKDYTHSTAPNRRFPDLLTQRLLKAAIAGAPLPYTIPELTAFAGHCTTREDDARRWSGGCEIGGRAFPVGQDRNHRRHCRRVSKGTWVRLPARRGKLERVPGLGRGRMRPRQADPDRRRAWHRPRAAEIR
jgi:exoribonuclease-2